MGGYLSSSKQIEPYLNYVTSSLDHHKECMKGLELSFESQNAQFASYLDSKDNHLAGGDAKAIEAGNKASEAGNNDASDAEKKHEHLSQTFRNILTLVKSNQSSLQCHLKVLRTSFNMLENNIAETIHQLAPGHNSRGNEVQEARKNLDKIHNLTLRVSGLEKENKDLEKKIQVNTTENKNLTQNIEELRELTQNIEELREQITNLQERNTSLETSEASLRKDLKEHGDIVPIQMFYQSRGDTMSKVTHELKTLLANKLQLGRSKIQFIDCQTEEDVNIEIPLFIVCINTSRLGTDVGSTLQKLKGCVSSKVSILIFHHKDIHALPSQSSERVLTGPVFKEIGGIFDLAFLSDKGIYQCDMNDNTADKIVTVLKSKD